MKRIMDDPGIANHGEAIDFFNQLILDLKKKMHGFPHEEITAERLDQGTKHVGELMQCRSQSKFY